MDDALQQNDSHPHSTLIMGILLPKGSCTDSYQSYQAYERGIAVPTLQNFIKLAKFYDVSLEDSVNENVVEKYKENNPIVMYIEDDLEYAIAAQYFSNQLSK